MNININCSVNYNVAEALTVGFGTANVPDQAQPAYAFASGTGSNQCDLHWEATGVVLAASASTTYVLSSLIDALGRTVALAHVRGFLLRITSRTAGDYLTLGGATTHAWTGGPGTTTCYATSLAVADLTDGWAVTAGSSDQLKITNSGSHPITFDLGLFGTST